ncbi:MAG: GNAT family N-acetyltransferase [Clostridiales bacterium]|nr:GNAT family N-acetyltransferase [Clostridiales bacterium]
MLQFRKPNIDDRQWVTERVNSGITDGCCYTFGSLFAWGSAYNIEIADYDGFLLIRGSDQLGRYYAYPSGSGDAKAAIEAMIEDCRKDGCPFRLEQILPECKAELERIMPDAFDFTYDRDSCEYVYSVENMAELPGKKFHGKKGHVKAFFKNHTDISCDPITADNISDCMLIEDMWLSEKSDDYGSLAMEHKSIETSLKNFRKLGLIGAILYVEGKPAAFTLGEKMKNNTFCTHYEKTVPEYKDAFPVINNGFTKLMLPSYKYVNREDDAGVPGLRKAKLSYHPEFMVEKYSAVLKNDPARKYKAIAGDYDELKHLWMSVFGDDSETVDFFLENTADFGKIYAYRENGKIVSAFYIIDSSITIDSTEHKAAYLYGAATLPEYRGRGIMSDMIKYASDWLKKTGFDYLFLYPATDNLYGFYENLGFETAFRSVRITVPAELPECEKGNFFKTSLDYYSMREYIPSDAYVNFPNEFLDFAVYCADKFGICESAVFDDEDKVFIIGSKDESGKITVDEALSSAFDCSHILSVVSSLGSEFDITVNAPLGTELKGCKSEIVNSGMIMSLCGEKPDKPIFMGQPCM